MRYSKQIDAKWQQRWDQSRLYSFNTDRVDDKLYCLSMFSYPSGAKLHVGHWYNFGLTDTWARVKRLQGYEVFEPMGFDAFGLPAENYAIQTGIHPKTSTWTNIETMRTQLHEMGAMFDWDYEVVTCDPKYYRWTQWLFLKLYQAGLAYRADAPVNWCSDCGTVLANEQVIDGTCERCGTMVDQKEMTQWFFRITDYADRLLDNLPDLDWPERTKTMQRHWIGRSEGTTIHFPLVDGSGAIECFTTRPDTLFGATYLVLAPDHPMVEPITTSEQKAAILDYREQARRQTEMERLSTEREKTGVFTGGHVKHPLSGENLPVWVADYVIYGYGTGAIMAVPGHDERDHEFSQKFGLPIPRVIEDPTTDDSLPYTGEGQLTNSPGFDGLDSGPARTAITSALEEIGRGEASVSYRLRDWLVSRQRYWGAPIPMIHCSCCGVVPVPENELPVRLPEVVDYTPAGKSPLASADAFIRTDCPDCGGPAERDPDTLDTFVDSSWYFLRYPDNQNDSAIFDPQWINQMLPVDRYVGGSEHAVMHLLYARFITMFLYDEGLLDFEEPFTSLTHQGVILGPDGRRMSKSRGNVVSPDDYINTYGSDVFRLYLAFGFNYVEGGAWDDSGIRASARFVDRVARWVEGLPEARNRSNHAHEETEAEKELEYERAHAITKITDDVEVFQFNTCVARLMELTNALYRYAQAVPAPDQDIDRVRATTQDLLILLAPFAPHFAEEMWEQLGYPYSIFDQSWPVANADRLQLDTVELAVQINGKVRATIEVPKDASEADIEKTVRQDARLRDYLAPGVKKTIVVPNKLINYVVNAQ